MPAATYGITDPVVQYWIEQSSLVLDKAKRDYADGTCKDRKAAMRSSILQQWEMQSEAVKQSWARATKD